MRTRVFRLFQLIVQPAALLIAMSAGAVAISTDSDTQAIAVKREPLLDLAAEVELAWLIGNASESHHSSIPVSEYSTFSGIGAIVCSVGNVQRAATAFLVGGFDIAVTVAHAFEFASGMAQPANCEYLVSGPLGLIRERIPLAKIDSQWRTQLETFGRPDCDLAVIRLHSPAVSPQRTLSLTKFASTGAPVSLVGFSPELATDPQQRRLRGRVYLRPRSGCVRFSHDVQPRLISSGAPLIDRRDGVVIGIHSYLQEPLTRGAGSCKDRGNAMLLMNEWLERTLRAEIAAKPPTDTVPPIPASPRALRN